MFPDRFPIRDYKIAINDGFTNSSRADERSADQVRASTTDTSHSSGR